MMIIRYDTIYDVMNDGKDSMSRNVGKCGGLREGL